MSTNNFQVNGIIVTAGGYTDTLGATVTYSVARDVNTLIMNFRVVTNSTGQRYNSFNSTHAITATVKAVASNTSSTQLNLIGSPIIVKPADYPTGSSIFDRSGGGSYKLIVDPTTTSVRILVEIQHNNDKSGSAFATIKFPAGYGEVGAPGTPQPKDLTTPWRDNTYAWKIPSAQNGVYNKVAKYNIKYQIYQNGAWSNWSTPETVTATTASSFDYIKPKSFFKTINEGNRVRISVCAVGEKGDVSLWKNEQENTSWTNLPGAGSYQTQNTAPEGPTFETSSPLSLNNPIVKLSSAHGSTNNYNSDSSYKGQSYLSFGIINTNDTPSLKKSDWSRPGDKKVYSFNVSNYLIPGGRVTLRGGVSDGWEVRYSTKDYLCGKILSTPSISLDNTSKNEFLLSISDITIDGQKIHSSITRTKTIKIKYSYQSSYTTFKTITDKGSMEVVSMTKKDIFNTLGVPNNINAKLQVYVTVKIPEYSAVSSEVSIASFNWITNYPTPTISARDGYTTPYYREGTYVPAVMENITFSIMNPNPLIEYRIGTTVIQNGTTYSVAGLIGEGIKDINCEVYEKYSAGSIFLGKIGVGRIYKINKRIAKVDNTISNLNSSNILNNENINFNIKNNSNFKMKGNINIYFNDIKVCNLDYNSINNTLEINIIFSKSPDGYLPSNGYKITSINGKSVGSGKGIVNIHQNNVLKIEYENIKELFGTVPYPTNSDLIIPVSKYSSITVNSDSISLSAFSNPVINNKNYNIN